MTSKRIRSAHELFFPVFICVVVMTCISLKQNTLHSRRDELFTVKEKTSLVMLAFTQKRKLNWEKMLDSYCEMDDVIEKILFIWQDPSTPPPDVPSCKIKLKIIHSTRNSLNNRYRYKEEIDTRTAVSVDDDVLVSKSALTNMIVQSQYHDLVGMDYRSFSAEGQYSFWWFMFPNKLILTGTCIVPVKYWKMYMRDTELTTFIDRMHNCEDIAMNFVVKNATGQDPALLSLGFFENGRTNLINHGGLSTTNDSWNWGRRRSECVKWMILHFPNIRLK